MRLLFSGWKANPRSVDLVHLLRRDLNLSLGKAKQLVDSIVARPVEVVEMPNETAARSLSARGIDIGLYAEPRGKRLYVTGCRPAEDRGALALFLSSHGEFAPDEAARIAERLTLPAPTSIEVSERQQAQRCSEAAEQLGFVCTVAE